ncbi:hypothetical protein HK097_006782 [Rhizophlyctis rosea]|uniref:Uncharacterized protein n=1 Tax=Rhizophlyctis rosea TaxID=64517 RepID=A0AAD5SIZ4_9FUNG|nr:hypothetical protein HK097_006782 [Rhizophlyctis rosea]
MSPDSDANAVKKSPPKPPRNQGVYVPRARRLANEAKSNAEAAESSPSSADTLVQQSNGSPAQGKQQIPNGEGENKRRGRGSFLAPDLSKPKPDAPRVPRQPPARVYPKPKPLRASSPPDDSSNRPSSPSAWDVERCPSETQRSKPAPPAESQEDDDQIETIVVKLAHADVNGGDDDGLEEWERDGVDEVVLQEEPSKPAPSPHPRRTITKEEVQALDAPTGPTKVLEVYDFPAVFKTHDLQQIFADYEDVQGNYCKVGVCEQLGSSDGEGMSVQEGDMVDMEVEHEAFVQVRPFTGPIPDSGRRSVSPDRARPVTSDMVARRLVAGALGVRTKRKTEEEEAAEKAKLQEEKDRRNAEKQQKIRKEQELAAAWAD